MNCELGCMNSLVVPCYAVVLILHTVPFVFSSLCPFSKHKLECLAFGRLHEEVTGERVSFDKYSILWSQVQ